MRRRAGFTLIELLIVMAIIAALMAVLTPTATGAMRKATATKIAVQLRNIEQAVEQYLYSMLPKADDLNTSPYSELDQDDDFKNFTNVGLLNNNEVDIKLIADTTNKRVKIALYYNAPSTVIAQLIVGTLREAYGGGTEDTNLNTLNDIDVNTSNGAYYNETKVFIIKSIDAFWW
jgi:prepilin-type N-terminal cleavage/methylation domain-containing protein